MSYGCNNKAENTAFSRFGLNERVADSHHWLWLNIGKSRFKVDAIFMKDTAEYEAI